MISPSVVLSTKFLLAQIHLGHSQSPLTQHQGYLHSPDRQPLSAMNCESTSIIGSKLVVYCYNRIQAKHSDKLAAEMLIAVTHQCALHKQAPH